MGNSNVNLQNAKNAKDDEFYTTYETIDKELVHYSKHFHGKTILCNCDDPFESNFSKYFLKNFNKLGLKRLLCTSYKYSKILSTQSNLCDEKDNPLENKNGYILDVVKFTGNNKNITDDYIEKWLKETKCIHKLKGDGDFRSTECIKYMNEADIVVTNPPFSLFKDMVSLLVKYKKNYILIGNQNALTYKEIFPLIKNNEAWTGYKFGDMKFRVPNDSKPRKTRFWIDEFGQKWRSLGNAMWFTNLDIERRHQYLKLTKKYSEKSYPKYDNYDAIDVKRVQDIPMDYSGIMGVPITIIDKYNSEQFTIIGEANHGSDNEYDLFKPTIKGKELFKKILIKNKMINAPKDTNYRILDLFCGAGGFSYGIEKNPHFKTVLALDNDPTVAETFKNNIPNSEIVIGNISDSKIKDILVKKSKYLKVNMIIGGPPCQGYSNKGKKLGLADPRNFLFREYLNLVKKIQPDIFIIENVKALLSASNGWFKDEIISNIKKLGYYVEYGVLNALNYGVPQARERTIFICSKHKSIHLPKATVNNYTTVRDAISDLSYLESGEGCFEQNYKRKPLTFYQKLMRNCSNSLFNHLASKHKQVAIDKLKMIPPEKGKEFLPKELRGKQKFKTTWGRLKWDEPSPTIDTRFDAASNGTNNHPFLNRAITPREAARLQSFDDKFIFYGSKVHIRKQIGNAVPPLMAEAIADNILEELKK